MQSRSRSKKRSMHPCRSVADLAALAQHDSLNRARASGAIVTFNQNCAEANVSGSRFKSHRHVVQEPSDDLFFVHADHALIRAGHPNVSDIGGAFGKNALVGRWNMCM